MGFGRLSVLLVLIDFVLCRALYNPVIFAYGLGSVQLLKS